MTTTKNDMEKKDADEDRSIASLTQQVCRSFLLSGEMYAGRVTCCSMVSHGEYADVTDRHRMDARPLHYAFRYGSVKRNKYSCTTRPLCTLYS